MVQKLKETVRLYGGPGDGKLVTVDIDVPPFEIIYPEFRPATSFIPGESPLPGDSSSIRHVYRRRRLVRKGAVFHIYVHSQSESILDLFR